MKETYIIDKTIEDFAPVGEYNMVHEIPVKEGIFMVKKYSFICDESHAKYGKVALNTQKNIVLEGQPYNCGPHDLEFGAFENEFADPGPIYTGKSLQILAKNTGSLNLTFKMVIELEILLD